MGSIWFPGPQLQAFWPGALVFAALDSPISPAFIERYPSPADARGLGAGRMAASLERNPYCGRTEAAELVARLKAAPTGTAGPGEREARRAVVAGLIGALGPIVAEIAKLSGQIRERLAPIPTRRSSGRSSATRRRRPARPP